MADQRAYAGRDIEFQAKEWTAQRVGWIAMVAIVLLAASGLLGNAGPLATAERSAPDGSLSITYFRFDRHHAPGELDIEVAPAFVEEGEVRLWIDAELVARLGIERISPEPESVEMAPERYVYVFAVAEPGEPLTVAIDYKHNGYWRERGQIGLENGAPITLSQFVFP